MSLFTSRHDSYKCTESNTAYLAGMGNTPCTVHNLEPAASFNKNLPTSSRSLFPRIMLPPITPLPPAPPPSYAQFSSYRAHPHTHINLPSLCELDCQPRSTSPFPMSSDIKTGASPPLPIDSDLPTLSHFMNHHPPETSLFSTPSHIAGRSSSTDLSFAPSRESRPSYTQSGPVFMPAQVSNTSHISGLASASQATSPSHIQQGDPSFADGTYQSSKNKRTEQNRKAQRAFRQRRDASVC
jgi:hypothetical protein